MILQKYDSYKDSGVEWLGEIPEDWEVKRVKDVSRIYNGSTPKSDTLIYWDGDIVWITPKDVSKNDLIFDSERKITKEGYLSCGTFLTNPDSIIMTTRAPIGNLSISKVITCTNQGCKSLVPNSINYKFFFYLLYSQNLKLQSLGSGTTFLELSTSELKAMLFQVPKLEGQTKIANFLDKKTSQIDSKINLLQEKITNYEGLKKSMINETVFRRLNKNAQLKDSEIEWIGKIPKHWKLIRGKDTFCGIGKSKISASEGEDEGKYKFFTSSVNQAKWLNTFTETNEEIIFSTGGIAGVHYCDKEFSYSTDCYAVKNKSNFLKYYFYYFKAILYEIDTIAFQGAGLRHLQKDFIKSGSIPNPPKEEQIAIANYLDEKTIKINNIILKIKDQINTLKEFRKTLINDVVTGKVRVLE